MANLRELNQQDQNPFWQWVADIETQNRQKSNDNNNNDDDDDQGASQRTTPAGDEKHDHDKDMPDHDVPDWDEKMPPPPPEFDDPPSPPPPAFDAPPGPPPPPGSHGPSHPPPPPHHHPHHHHGGDRSRNHHRGGPFGGGGRGGWGWGHHRGGHHGPGGAPPFGGGFPFGGAWAGPWGERGRHCRRGRGAWEQMFGPRGFDLSQVSEALKTHLGFDPIGAAAGNARDGPAAGAGQDDEKDFTPAIDLFDTPAAYFIHISLPGAKKQDLDVSWDQERYQVIVSGIIHRPGDESFLKTIAVEERDIGVFERKIRLGTRAEPVSVDADGISAKMEDGVLMIKVPKVEEFVEVRKVDIE